MTDPGEVELHIETVGTGPPVVLAHGFGGSARNFRPQARALRNRYRIVLYDARGHARSATPLDPALYTAEQLVMDVGRVLDREHAEQAVVGGLSMGAGTALGFALAWPERVRALMLAAFPPGAKQRREENLRQADWALAFADAIEAKGLEVAGAEFAWGPRSGFDASTARLVRQGMLEHSPHALAHLLRQVLTEQRSAAELAPQLRELRIPALVVVGAQDRLSRGPSEVLARSLRGARLVVIPDAGHIVNLAAPREFNAALGEFLDGLPPPAP
ncbi:MAG TPA: alpha/beta hydrolase [Myxococcota bacterium]|nr:alpha/beta hydrolase [Myxococcota bacterium]